MAPTPPIAPSLFDNVTAYSKALQDGSVDVSKPLSDTTSILVFCQNFFAQFFENVLDAPFTAIDDQTKEDAAAIRLGWSQHDSAAPIRHLIALFEELCDEWPEVLGLIYGSLRDDMLEFHDDFLPSLLEAIADWASSANHAAILERAKTSRAAYMKGLAALRSRRRKQ